MPAQPLLRVLTQLRQEILDPEALVRAVASGRRRGHTPAWRRVELRYVDLKAGRRLQVTAYDDRQAHTSNHEPGDDARDAVDALLDEPFGNWHVDTTTQSHQVRVTKKGDALLHTAVREADVDGQRNRDHDRDKGRLLPADDPVFVALGLSDHEGRMKPSRQGKYRQVEEFLRILDASVSEAIEKGHLRRPTEAEPLRMADLGCGNGYLTFAAQRYLTHVRGLPVVVTGVDVRRSPPTTTPRSPPASAWPPTCRGWHRRRRARPGPDVVLALHACDTATDDALARAVGWEAPLVLAAPCCHHDIAAQLRTNPTPAPYAMLTRHGILRERFADTLTDACGPAAAAAGLPGRRHRVRRLRHTPRNALLRAVRTRGPDSGGAVRAEYDDLVATWGIRPEARGAPRRGPPCVSGTCSG